MTRIQPLDPAKVQGPAKDLLSAVQASLGVTPNMFKALAHSPAALEGLLSLNGALGKGTLPAAHRSRIALAVAEANRCAYCASAHTVLGAGAGLTELEILDSRKGGSAKDPQSDALLAFVKVVVQRRGLVSDEEVQSLRAVGFGDAELAEIIAHVALNLFTNYFNLVAETEVDFPLATVLA